MLEYCDDDFIKSIQVFNLNWDYIELMYEVWDIKSSIFKGAHGYGASGPHPESNLKGFFFSFIHANTAEPYFSVSYHLVAKWHLTDFCKCTFVADVRRN